MSSIYNAYTKKVLKQVKFIFDHQSIRRELNSHIQDLIDEHNWNNLPEEELILKINDEMGDPIDLGKSLNQVHKPLLGYAWIISKSIFVIVLFASALNFISLVDRTAYQKPNIMNTINMELILESIGENQNKDYSQIKYRDWILNKVIDMKDSRLVIERIILLEDNNLILFYRNPPKFSWVNQSSHVYMFDNLKVLDQDENQYYRNYEIQMGVNDVMIGYYDGVPFDTKSVKLDFKQVKESFSLIINGDDYE